MRLLAVATEPITAAHLRAAIGPDALDDAEVVVVAPALHDSALRFWVSDADDAIARAHEIEARSVRQLRAADVAADGDVGEGDLTQAVRDALVTFPADRVVLFTHPPGERRYREAVSAIRLADDLGVAIETYELEASSG